MATFRPSARARIQIRLEEGADTAAMDARLERDAPAGATVQDTIPTTAAGRDSELADNRQRRRAIVRQRAMLSADELRERTGRLDQRRATLQLGAADQVKPFGLETVLDDDLTIGVDLVPINVKVIRNGIMEADECVLTFDYLRAPIDPRVIRAAFVDVAIGSVTSRDFADGVEGATRPDGSLLSTIERVPGDELRFESATQFLGYVDEWSTQLEDGDTIEVRCRDLTAPLIDRRLPTGLKIDLQKRIADGVEELVNYFPATRGMRVVFGSPDGGDFDRGDRGPIPADTVPKPRKSRRGSKVTRTRSGDHSMSVWDHIVDTVIATGHVPVVRGLALYLIEPRTFYSRTDGAKKLVFGQNLSRLGFARKLGGWKVPTIEVRCPDPSIGRTRWARAPVKAGQPASGVFGISDPPKVYRANQVSPGGATEDEIKTILVSGVSDGETLERIARAMFEQVGRQEIEGSFETWDISSFESDTDGDLLDLQSGDPVDVRIAPLRSASTRDVTGTLQSGVGNTQQELQSQTIGKRRAFLQELGFDREAAERLAVAQSETALGTTFRAQNLTITFDQREGVNIEGDFINFLVVRESPGAARQPASDAVQFATAGNTSLAAQQMIDASAAGNTLGAEAMAGDIAPGEYAERSAEERARQQRAAQALRRNG